jgi:hypothetical protein
MGEGGQYQAPLGFAQMLGALQPGTIVEVPAGYIQQQALGVAQQGLWQTTMPVGQWFAVPNEACHCEECMRRGFRYYRPSLTTAEFAEDYYDQCCGTPRSPKERAQELLFDHLTWEEREEWWLTNRITVTAKSGRRYWISGTDCGRLDDGHTFCVYIGMNECPAEDRVLGLKLAIETDEKQFLKTAVDRGAPYFPQAANNPIFTAALGQYHGIPLTARPRLTDRIWAWANGWW